MFAQLCMYEHPLTSILCAGISRSASISKNTEAHSSPTLAAFVDAILSFLAYYPAHPALHSKVTETQKGVVGRFTSQIAGKFRTKLHFDSPSRFGLALPPVKRISALSLTALRSFDFRLSYYTLCCASSAAICQL